MCGESWLATNPLPQFSRLGIQVSLAIYVSLSRSWLGWLPFFFSYASVLNMYFHVYIVSTDCYRCRSDGEVIRFIPNGVLMARDLSSARLNYSNCVVALQRQHKLYYSSTLDPPTPCLSLSAHNGPIFFPR